MFFLCLLGQFDYFCRMQLIYMRLFFKLLIINI